MPRTSSSGERHWLSLRAASRTLEVNRATLRQWADSGRIRVFRTPGGHRRFLKGDIYALLGVKGRPEVDFERLALKRVRRRLHARKVAEQPWYRDLDEEGRAHMRLFGRQLLSLISKAATARRRQELLAEAYNLGLEYGREMVRRNFPLKVALEAFIFFRNSVLEGASSQLLHHISPLVDQVLLGTTSIYERERWARGEAYPQAH